MSMTEFVLRNMLMQTCWSKSLMKILRKEKSNLKQIRIVHRVLMNKNNALWVCYITGKVNVIIWFTVLYSGYLWTMDIAFPNLYVTGKINVILGFTMWHFQKSGNKVCRWRRLLSCLSQEYLKKYRIPEIIFFIYTSRVRICALRCMTKVRTLQCRGTI